MLKKENIAELVAAINERRPLVLLLGQNFWNTSSQNDPIMVDAFKKIARHPNSAEQYSLKSILTSTPLPEGFYNWMAGRYMKQVETDWFEAIAQLPLSAVFTSGIDPSLPKMFRGYNRDVQSILSVADKPITPRNRSNLNITYLFGRAGESSANEAPPQSKQQLLRRTTLQAAPLLSQLVETTTSLGILLIDGLDCDQDWLSVESVYGVLSAFNHKQVFWFGWDPKHTHKDSISLLDDLADPNGPITFFPERLSTVLRALVLEGRIPSSECMFPSDNSITIDGKVLDIEPSIRFKTTTNASILDDSWTAPLPMPKEDLAYEEFRRFHGNFEETRRMVEGIRHGFAIKRSFEKNLYSYISEALGEAGSFSKPILIHGQSGSGKSIVLARMAFEFCKEHKYPVLLASRTFRLPTVNELDEFCLSVEKSGARGTLIICDANVTYSRYQELLRGFQSRGRKVVIVGSTYRVIDQAHEPHDDNLFEVLSTLNEEEITQLEKLLKNYINVPSQFLEKSPYLLSVIYRVLPNVRPNLATGLVKETHVMEDSLRFRGRQLTSTLPKPTGAIGQALLNAGLVEPRQLLEGSLDAYIDMMSDGASKIIDFVMLPGKLECPIPINLLMRAVGGNSNNLVDIGKLFIGIDLFRWSSNRDGDFLVHPRLRIEAELISARRLGTAQAEIDIAIDLIKAANPSNYDDSEKRFILDLVQRLGADGPFGLRYASFYYNIAEALTKLREKRSFFDPSLMLQEATLRRQAFRHLSNDPLSDKSVILLEEARNIIDLAIDKFSNQSSARLKRISANLKVERAAIYGFYAVEQMKGHIDEQDVWHFYEAARDSAKSAINAADTYHATDVSLWIPADLLKGREWEPLHRAELTADIIDGLERVDISQLEPNQRELFQERRVRTSRILEDNKLENDALLALEEMGSPAAIFLRAQALGGILKGIDQATEEDITLAENVVNMIQANYKLVRTDSRSLRYLLRARWILATRTYMFGRERGALPINDSDLTDILQILDHLNEIEGVLGDPRNTYLRAVLRWLQLRENVAIDIWDELNQETSFNDPRRVIRQHIWTDLSGKPRLFHGRVVKEDIGDSGRFKVLVEELKQHVYLLQRDFPELELRRGTEIRGGFNIAFNFIGPVAEPLKRRGTK